MLSRSSKRTNERALGGRKGLLCVVQSDDSEATELEALELSIREVTCTSNLDVNLELLLINGWSLCVVEPMRSLTVD